MEAVRASLVSLLDAAGVAVDEVSETKLLAVLVGEWKRTIPVLFHFDERTLRVSSLFCAAPDQNHADVFSMLLHRNERPSPVHFALDDEGDVVLVGNVPYAALDEAALDGLLGAIVTTSDELFNRFVRTGFSDYLDHEQRWRQKNGLPPNPIATAP